MRDTRDAPISFGEISGLVYISGHGSIRSVIWVIALGLNIAILFTGL